MITRVLGPSLTLLFTLGCSSGSSGTGTNAADGGGSGGTGGGSGGVGGAGGSVPHTPGWQLGDGSLPSVQLTLVYQATTPRNGTDLGFHPTRDELWVLQREYYAGAPCTTTDHSGCDSNEGSVAIVSGAAGSNPEAVWKKDPNAMHFMRRATAIAFGVGDTFATVGEARTGNAEDDPTPYMGVTWWSSDPAIFAIQPPGKNGSHLDMLHSTPFGMGVAHQTDSIYWAFNGDAGSIDKVDFKQPHEPGGDDHSDGAILRYVAGQLERTPEVPSHLVFDSNKKLLYVADTGHQRIASLDTEAGTMGEPFQAYDPIEVHHFMDQVDLVDVVPPGTLQAPSGIEFFEDLLFVSDNATSQIHAFDLQGQLVRSLDTGLPPGTLAGIAIGPDQKLYFIDTSTANVTRIDPL
jgi:hypothetical protein